ncbi:MAG TPA: DUF5765 domain-containing protein [Geminicoccaceae bacterium]
MCLGAAASLGMVAVGTAATGAAARWRQPPAIWLTLGYFTVMEALQATGYIVVDQCGSPLNQSITLLSYLHIVFQPFFINAFAMELVPEPVKERVRLAVCGACAFSAVVMLMQLYPFEWAPPCRIGKTLCGTDLCLSSGEWHIAWSVPYNNLWPAFDIGIAAHLSFPTYMVAAFLVPLSYGAWRFVFFHALVGPFLAHQLTDNPNEVPAVWCLFSIGIVLMGLSPWLRQGFRTTSWWAWPRSWQT